MTVSLRRLSLWLVIAAAVCLCSRVYADDVYYDSEVVFHSNVTGSYYKFIPSASGAESYVLENGSGVTCNVWDTEPDVYKSIVSYIARASRNRAVREAKDNPSGAYNRRDKLFPGSVHNRGGGLFSGTSSGYQLTPEPTVSDNLDITNWLIILPAKSTPEMRLFARDFVEQFIAEIREEVAYAIEANEDSVLDIMQGVDRIDIQRDIRIVAEIGSDPFGGGIVFRVPWLFSRGSLEFTKYSGIEVVEDDLIRLDVNGIEDDYYPEDEVSEKGAGPSSNGGSTPVLAFVPNRSGAHMCSALINANVEDQSRTMYSCGDAVNWMNLYSDKTMEQYQDVDDSYKEHMEKYENSTCRISRKSREVSSDVVVMVADSGFSYGTPGVSDNLSSSVISYDARTRLNLDLLETLPSKGDTEDSYGDCGHGTSIIGRILSEGLSPVKLSKVYSLKFYSTKPTSARLSDILSVITLARAIHKKHSVPPLPSVLLFGALWWRNKTPDLIEYFQQMDEEGIVVIAPSGNYSMGSSGSLSGIGCNSLPSGLYTTLTIGSTKYARYELASFNSQDDKCVDAYACGEGVLVPASTKAPLSSAQSIRIRIASGTSFAAADATVIVTSYIHNSYSIGTPLSRASDVRDGVLSHAISLPEVMTLPSYANEYELNLINEKYDASPKFKFLTTRFMNRAIK